MMEIKMLVTHEETCEGGGDRPIELVFNDINQTDTVNMYLNGEHFRIDLTKLAKVIKAFT